MTAEERAIEALKANMKYGAFVPTPEDDAWWLKYKGFYEHPDLPRNQFGEPKTMPKRGENKHAGQNMAERILTILREAGLKVVTDG